jgi:hypothetical protein
MLENMESGTRGVWGKSNTLTTHCIRNKKEIALPHFWGALYL